VPPWIHEQAEYAPPAALTVEELLTLQLAARGYALDQIADLRSVPVSHVVGNLWRAAQTLETATIATTLAKARARGLIV
jgi:hypothetical protein